MNTKRPKIGIMQGRLSHPYNNKIQSFPTINWKDEFEKAQKCGFESIEWVFDSQDNPILDDKSTSEISRLSEKYEIKINSVCADFFMDNKLFGVTNYENNTKVLGKLIESCSKLCIKYIEIPLVDSSSINDDIKSEQQLVKNIKQILPFANDNNVSLILETDLPPKRFLNLLQNFEHNVFANYDTGNSTALGYNLVEELTTYGHIIKNIHIKDRLLHGDTVPFGTGNTNFDLFFSMLKKISYVGDLIIQGAREEYISPEQTCLNYIKFVKQYLDKYFY